MKIEIVMTDNPGNWKQVTTTFRTGEKGKQGRTYRDATNIYWALARRRIDTSGLELEVLETVIRHLKRFQKEIKVEREYHVNP